MKTTDYEKIEICCDLADFAINLLYPSVVKHTSWKTDIAYYSPQDQIIFDSLYDELMFEIKNNFKIQDLTFYTLQNPNTYYFKIDDKITIVPIGSPIGLKWLEENQLKYYVLNSIQKFQ